MKIHLIIDDPPNEQGETTIVKAFLGINNARKFMREAKGKQPYENQYYARLTIEIEDYPK